MFQPDENVFELIDALQGREGATIDLDVRMRCRGVDAKGNSPLEHAVKVVVHFGKPVGQYPLNVSANGCPYNTGSHGQRCKASHPEVDKIGEGVKCPYSLDIPYVDITPHAT